MPAGVRDGRYDRRWEFMRLPGESRDSLETESRAWELLQPWVSRDQATIVRHKVYTFRSLLADTWRRGRPLIAGDAAHVMPPFMGQGLCAGLRDVWNLAWKLDLVPEAFSEDIRTRIADEKLAPAGIAFDAHDIAAGVVFDRGGVKVTAFATHHGDLIDPNFGCMVEHDGKRVVISSDTTDDERIAKQAAGADLLLHEVAAIDPALLKEYPRLEEIAAHHTSPEDAGRIFSIARPKLAAYTHIIVLNADAPLDVPADEVVSRTRKTDDGPLALGEDLMQLRIDRGGIQVVNARGQVVPTQPRR